MVAQNICLDARSNYTGDDLCLAVSKGQVANPTRRIGDDTKNIPADPQIDRQPGCGLEFVQPVKAIFVLSDMPFRQALGSLRADGKPQQERRKSVCPPRNVTGTTQAAPGATAPRSGQESVPAPP